METATLQPAAPQQHTNHSIFEPNIMDTSMDIDMELDLGPGPEPDPIEMEPPAPSIAASTAEQSATSALNEEHQFDKVHIRGVDDLTTDDVLRFATEHFKAEEPLRIEWIDDTSANIVYSSAEVGVQALAELTQQHVEEESASPVGSIPSLRLRTAKSLSTHLDSVLQVRSAVSTDRKRKRAHEASRFYLMHPEHDPRERVRKGFDESRQARRGRRGGYYNNEDNNEDSGSDYTRRRFDDKELRRRRRLAEEESYSASMYGDTADGRGSGDLFPDSYPSSRSKGRLRDRSASPERSGRADDGESGVMERSRNGERKRFRDRSPRPSRQDPDLYTRSNQGKELFPPSNGNSPEDEERRRRELFPDKTAANFLKKELFPNKTNLSNHRRSDAFDAAADETADLFSKRMPAVPFVDESGDTKNKTRKDTANIELFLEQNGDAAGIKIRRGAAQEEQGISIRGYANKGFSIKGGAAASVKELFPSKYNPNEGKELFSDKLEGRGGRRRKAEDMFY